MIIDNVKATGKLHIHHINEFGDVIQSKPFTNLIVTLGKAFIVSRMNGNVKAPMTHMGVGSSIIAPTLSDIALITQVSDRVLFDSTPVTSTNNITYITTFLPGVCTGLITEAGIFNAATGGDMLCRTTFTEFNKAVGDTIIITWNVNIQ